MKKIYDNNGNLFAELNYGKRYFLNYSRHSHETFALSIIGSGELEIEFHSKPTEKLLPNQIVIFNPNEVHRTKNKVKDTLDYFTLHLDVNICKNIQKKVFSSEDAFINLQNLIDDKNIYNKLLKIFHSIIENKKNIELFKLEEIIEDILITYAQNNDIQDSNKNEHLILKELEKYILENINNQISLKDMALAVGYNESYVTRVFKQKFGLSPHAYLINKRVEKARKKLIKNKNISLAQLSNEVGFYDQSHFIKVFKRVFAKTPNKYKNEK